MDFRKEVDAQWNPKPAAVLMIVLLLVLASLAGLFDLPDSLNLAW